MTSDSPNANAPLPPFVDRWINRIEVEIGVIAPICGLAAFGLSFMFFSLWFSVGAAMLGFAVSGGLFWNHSNAKTTLALRQKDTHEDVLGNVRRARPDWHHKIIKEIKHHGIVFHAIGFDELQIAMDVSQPLCTACGGILVERARVVFPGRIKIQFVCPCGVSVPSAFTLSELSAEARRIANVPT